MAEMPRWTILRKLGEGGSGSVFLTCSPSGETVAVKLLSSGEGSETLEREAGLLTRLKHPHIAAVQGYLKDSSEIFGSNRGPCFWMEQINGPDLLTAAKQVSADRDAKIVRWFHEALEALAYLHREKVFHGDLTPLNLKIGADGRLKILDFGLASVGRAERLPHDGTLFYMAPERFQGIQEAAGDLFSLGTVFYEALAGVHPREGCRSLSAMFRAEPKPLGDVLPKFAFPLEARVIDRMIRSNAAERFSSIAEILQALDSQKVWNVPSESRFYYPREFYGAEPHLMEIDAALDDLPRKSGIAAVHGVSGVGRSRFLNEITFRAERAGVKVVDVPPSRFREALEKLAEGDGPAVHLFRDLHEVPRAELAALVSLRRAALPPQGRLFVFEWNDDAIDAERLRLLRHSPVAMTWKEIVLGNLSASDARSFLAGGLGEETASEVADSIFTMTRGNPRLLLEWISVFREKNWTSKKHFPREWLESAEGGEILAQARLKGLDPMERSLLEVLAVAGDSAGLEEILEVSRRAASGLSDDEELAWVRVAALENLAGEGFILIEPAEDRHAVYRLALPAMGRALVRSFSGDEKLRLHGLWTDVLANEPDAGPRKIAHVIALGDPKRIVPALTERVDGLRREERSAAALELVERAFEKISAGGDPSAFSRLLRLKTNVLNDLGRYKDALDCSERNRALAAPDEPREVKEAKYWLVTGLIYENLGDAEESLKRFEACAVAAAALPDEKAYYLARSKTLAAKQLLSLGRKARAITLLEEALASTPSGRLRAEICRNLADAVSSDDAPRAKTLIEEAASLYRDDGYHRGEFGAYLLEGNWALGRGRMDEAEAAYAKGEALAAAHKDDLLLARVWNNRGVLARQRGGLAEGLDLCGKSLEIFRSLGSPGDLAESLKQNAVTETHLGRFPRAEGLLDEIRGLAAQDGRLSGKAADVEREITRLRDGKLPEETTAPELLKQELTRIYASLPKGLQTTFVDRFDYRIYVLNQGGKP